jgi:hypothetical protein
MKSHAKHHSELRGLHMRLISLKDVEHGVIDMDQNAKKSSYFV